MAGELKYLISVVYPDSRGERWLAKSESETLPFDRDEERQRFMTDSLTSAASIMRALADAKLEEGSIQELKGSLLNKMKLITSSPLLAPCDKAQRALQMYMALQMYFTVGTKMRIYRAMVDSLNRICVLERMDEYSEVPLEWIPFAPEEKVEPNYNLSA